MTKRICVLAGFDAPAAERILALRARLREKGKTVFDLHSDHAAYEFVPEHGR